MASEPIPEADGVPAELEERFYEIWLDRPDDDRRRDLAELCAAHPEHGSGLRALARRLDRSDGALAPLAPVTDLFVDPERIGPYAIRGRIGEGGFGVVYRAEQERPVRRTVALKLLRVGHLDAHALARFDNERQSLAVMDHPSIAHVFDAGMVDGRPYFAMELVDGRPITAHCDAVRATVATRLALFLQVCSAVDHAHRKGVVHRDIKPGNVLVSTQDGVALPRVIDFGIAKALSNDGGEPSYRTLDGALVGTPEYMSPEQAAGRTVDVRSDVYALGVLLFELLTGDLPFERRRLHAGSLIEMARIVCEEEPRRPSAVMSAGASAIAAARGTTPRQLLGDLRGDLEWILRKCLEKDPDRRYGSVGALAADIERYLRDQPVEARQPAFSYLAGKFMRRHRLGVSVAAVVLLAAAVGVAALVWALLVVDGARREEVAHRNTAELQSYAAHVAAAKLAFDTGAIGNAQRHLADANPALRGWEWRHVHALCDSSQRQLAVGPMPDGVAWLSDHELLIADKSGFDGEAGVPMQLWDLDRGEAARTFDCRGVAELLVDPLHARAVTSSIAGIELWDVRTAERRALLHTPVEDFTKIALALDPSGSRLVFTDARGVVRVADLDGDRAVTELGVADDLVAAIAMVDDATLVMALRSGGLSGRNLADFGELFHLDLAASRLQVGPGGRTLYAAAPNEIAVVDVATREVRCRLSTDLLVLRMQPSHDDGLLYVVGGWADGFVTCFDTANGEARAHFHGHQRSVRGLALSPDGTSFATGSRDRTVRLWPTHSAPASGQLAAGFDARCLTATADGELLASVAMDGTWTVWNARDCRVVASGNAGEPLFVGAPSNERLYAVGRTVRVFDLATGAPIVDRTAGHGIAPTWTAAQNTPRDAAVAPDGSWLALLAYDRVQAWRLPVSAAAAPAWRLDQPWYAHCLAIEPGAGRLALGCADGRVRLLDPLTGEVHEVIEGLGPRTRIDVDPGSTGELPIYRIAFWRDRIATAAADGKIRVLDRGSGRPPMVLRGHEVIASGVAFSPDGTRIASGGGDGYVRIWDAGSGIDLLPLRERREVAQEVHFSPDGTRILTRYHVWVAPSFLQWWDAPVSNSAR